MRAWADAIGEADLIEVDYDHEPEPDVMPDDDPEMRTDDE
jgi:hypothetical protein